MFIRRTNGVIYVLIFFCFAFSLLNLSVTAPSDLLRNDLEHVRDALIAQQKSLPQHTRILNENDTQTPDAFGKVANDDGKETDSFETANNVCSLPLGASSLSLENSSTNKIWKHFIPEIFRLSHNTNDDKEYAWHDFTALLLDFVTPRLQNSVRDLPVMHWDKVGNIIDKAFKRYKYLHDMNDKGKSGADDVEPLPVRVLILGGSVTMGQNCARYPNQSITIAELTKRCAWPKRLALMLKGIFGDVFQVSTFAQGGTNSKYGVSLIEYDLVNPHDKHIPFDIVINAYATNDMHILSVEEAEEKNTTLSQALFETGQTFIREVLKDSKRCNGKHLPLPIYYNDYLGNEQKGIMEVDTLSNVLTMLSSYYGIGHISFSEMIRHTVFGDTMETWFSPNDWPNRQIHPGRGFHIVTPWIFLYNFLEMATTYCDMKLANMLPLSKTQNLSKQQNSELSWTSGFAHTEGLPPLKNNPSDPKLPNPPLPLPFGLPPILENNLTLDNISSQWRTREIGAIAAEESACPKVDYAVSSCAFSFITDVSPFDVLGKFRRKMDRHLTHNDGWEATEENRKIGFTATKSNATFTIKVDIKELDLPVKALNLASMKSYGKKWEGSEVRMQAVIVSPSNTAQVSRREEQMFKSENSGVLHVSGFHDKKTSETYMHKLLLRDGQEAFPGDQLHVKFDLIGGSTFKISGMMFCDH